MLRESEDVAWRDLGRLEGGLPPSRARRVSSILNDVRVMSCSRQVMNGEMGMLHFLSSVSWHLDGTMKGTLGERPDQGRPQSPERRPPPHVSDASRFVRPQNRVPINDRQSTSHLNREGLMSPGSISSLNQNQASTRADNPIRMECL